MRKALAVLLMAFVLFFGGCGGVKNPAAPSGKDDTSPRNPPTPFTSVNRVISITADPKSGSELNPGTNIVIRFVLETAQPHTSYGIAFERPDGATYLGFLFSDEDNIRAEKVARLALGEADPFYLFAKGNRIKAVLVMGTDREMMSRDSSVNWSKVIFSEWIPVEYDVR